MKVYDKIDASVELWNRYLENEPGYLPYHRKLAAYYLDHDDPVKALPHLLVLIDNDIDLQSNLLSAAKIYLFDLGRADKSLYYYEQYKKAFPAGKDVSHEIADLQLILANDLLSIIENTGVWLLWRDLARITPDRIGIYRAMADLLEKVGREDELIEVLRIIIIHDPGDLETLQKLSSIYLRKHSYENCITFLDNAEKRDGLPASFYLLRAQCQEGLKNDIATLGDYKEYLKLEPDDIEIRVGAIKLAGAIGQINSLEQLYPDDKQLSRMERDSALRIETLFLDNLIRNKLYARAEKELSVLSGKYLGDSAAKLQLLSLKAAISFSRGNQFVAERLLRQAVVEYTDSIDVVLQLADQSIKRNDIQSVAAWLMLAEKLGESPDRQSMTVEQKSRLFYLQLLLDRLAGNGKDALIKAEKYLQERMKGQQLIASDDNVVLFLASAHFEAGEYEKCLELLRYYRILFRTSEKIPLLIGLVAEKHTDKNIDNTSGEESSMGSNAVKVEKRFSISEKLGSAEMLIQLKRFSWALSILDEVNRLCPESVRARALRAQASFSISDYDSAWHDYHTLRSSFPEENYFQEQMFRIEYLQGDTADIIKTFLPHEEKMKEGSPDMSQKKKIDAITDRLLLARSLWADYRWDESLKVYDALYFQLKEIISNSMIQLEEIPDYKLFLSRTFWGNPLFSPNDEEILDVFMAPSYFGQHLDSKSAPITAALYDSYRWHKIIKIERDAKSALNDREFYQAEKDYQDLINLDKEAGEESYTDLVTVYGRLGRNWEETELLEKIKELNTDYPMLENAAEKNVRQRQPHLLLDGKYRKEDGRNGYKNITQEYFGVSLSLMPTISQETSVWYARNEYGNNDSSTLAKSNFLLGQYNLHLNELFQFSATLGFEDFDTDGKSFLLYDVTINAQLADGLGLYATVKQAPVDDTIDSLSDGIYRRDFDAGLHFEFLPRIFFGFDFSIMNYSDLNDGQFFNLWGAYRLFGERSSVDLRYDYEMLENSIANADVPESEIEPGSTEPAYWSPGNYWKHFFSAEYKLELWPTGWMQSGTSSVSALYGMGYEEGDGIIQALDFNILLEINPIFLVKGTFASEWSGDYSSQEAFVSLAYRW